MVGAVLGLVIVPLDALDDGTMAPPLLLLRWGAPVVVLVMAWRRWVPQVTLERIGFGVLIAVGLVRIPSLFTRSEEVVAFAMAFNLLILSGVATFVFARRAAVTWILALAVVHIGTGWWVLRDSQEGLGAELLRLSVFSVFVMLALQADRLVLAEESRLARRDPLTGILNRRALAPALQQRVEAGGTDTVVLFDLDRFKAVNDADGHEAGDEVLQRTAEAAASMLRDGDQLARWGGEEFLVLLPGTDAEQARQVAERIRRSLRGDVGVTASFGVAEHRPGDTVARWVSRADRAMYAAKHLGRDRVELGR